MGSILNRKYGEQVDTVREGLGSLPDFARTPSGNNKDQSRLTGPIEYVRD